MDIIIIGCIVAGVACIGASFFIKENTGMNSQEQEKIAEEIRQKALSDESLKKVIAKVEKSFETRVADIAEEKLSDSSRQMSELTNNKMLAMDEMSSQLMVKIEQNHKEVIFLYDMLNEKSESLKDFSAKIDGMRKELENEEKRIKVLNHELDDKILKVKEVRQTVITKQPKQVQQEPKLPEQVSTQAEALVQMQQKKVAEAKMKQEVKTQSEVEVKVEKDPKRTEDISMNDKILTMKEEGKSVVEISKELGIGQGEVQLVLGLFGK